MSLFSRKIGLTSFGVVLGLSLTTSISWAKEPTGYPACTREPTESEVAAAKGAFDAGQVAFQEADYERAILYWEDAFRRDCTAAPLLLNLARAYELADARSHAVVALETYLERRPEVADRATIEKRLSTLKRQLEEERARSAPAPGPTPLESPARAEESGPSRPIWPIFLTGSGLALTGVGLGVLLPAQSKIDACPSDEQGVRVCPTSDATREAEDAVGMRNAGIALTAVGAGVAVGGAIAWALLWSGGEEESASALTPLFGPGYAGFDYRLRF